MFGIGSKLKRENKALQLLSQQYFNASITARINQQLQQLNSINFYPQQSTAETTDIYTTIDQVYSVVNKVAETSALIPIYSYQIKDQNNLKKLKSLTNRLFYTTKGIVDISIMRTKSLNDVTNDPLMLLLEQPNEYQSRIDFLQAVYIYYLLNGEAIIWIERIDAGADEGMPVHLHVFPPGDVSLYVSKTFPQVITGYKLSINGITVLDDVPPEDIIHWKRLNPKVSFSGAQFRGLSPLAPATNLTARLKESDIRSLNQLKNGTVPGIVYDKTLNGDEIEQTAFDLQKKKFYDFITNRENQGAPFFVGSEKGYLPIGLSAADMKIIELQKIDFKRLCNIYKVSDVLFNSDAASTESNVREQIKQMYTSACLPMVYSFLSLLNSKLVPLYDGVDYIDCDISSITELQTDIKLMMQAISYLPVSPTGNEIRSLMNYERIELPYMDQPLIKAGYTFYDDVSIPPVDPSLLDTGL